MALTKLEFSQAPQGLWTETTCPGPSPFSPMRSYIDRLSEKKRREMIKQSYQRRVEKIVKKFGEALTKSVNATPAPTSLRSASHGRFLTLSPASFSPAGPPQSIAIRTSQPQSRVHGASLIWRKRGAAHGARRESSRPPTPSLAPTPARASTAKPTWI